MKLNTEDLLMLAEGDTVEGDSLVGEGKRQHLYCEHFENDQAMRMIRAEQYKLIWYPVGNRLQLFDVAADPCEMNDLAAVAEFAEVRARLTALLVTELYGSDLAWVGEEGELVGLPDKVFEPAPNRGLSGQRGWR